MIPADVAARLETMLDKGRHVQQHCTPRRTNEEIEQSISAIRAGVSAQLEVLFAKVDADGNVTLEQANDMMMVASLASDLFKGIADSTSKTILGVLIPLGVIQ